MQTNNSAVGSVSFPVGSGANPLQGGAQIDHPRGIESEVSICRAVVAARQATQRTGVTYNPGRVPYGAMRSEREEPVKDDIVMAGRLMAFIVFSMGLALMARTMTQIQDWEVMGWAAISTLIILLGMACLLFMATEIVRALRER